MQTKDRTRKRRTKRQIFLYFSQKHFGSGGDENERQMENNVYCKEMRFVIRNLIDVDDVSSATAPEMFSDCLYPHWYFPEEERMMQHNNDKYFPQL